MSSEYVPTRAEAWRVGKTEVREWSTANGGHVTQIVANGRSRRVYGNVCPCGQLVTAVRDVTRHREGRTMTGRWPTYCKPCSRARLAEHDARAKDRMARRKAEQDQLRNENYRKIGRPIPKPGRRGRPPGAKNF